MVWTRPCISIASACCLLSAPATAQPLYEETKLVAEDGSIRDLFGLSVALAEELIAVGSPLDQYNGRRTGTVSLFDGATGNQVRTLQPIEGSDGDYFGEQLAVDQGRIAIGAYGDDTLGDRTGAAYVFELASGSQLLRVLPSDGSPEDEFGRSIALSADVLAVGAYLKDEIGADSGCVYLFDLSTGEETRQLLPSNGVAGDRFGLSVAIGSGVVVVGAPYADRSGARSGTVYIFDIATGNEIAELNPADGALGREFGWSVAIDGDHIVVGAPSDDHSGYNSGSVYVYELSSGSQVWKLTADDASENARFGVSVSLESDSLIVGAHHRFGDEAGAAYRFDVTTGEQRSKLLQSDGTVGDAFGQSVAVRGNMAIVGAPYDDENGRESGSAYVFDWSCRADLNDDGLIDTRDFLVFLSKWSANDLIADWNDDGTVNTQDFIAYLNSWTMGCP